MKHSMVTFRLHRTAVIFIVIGAVLFAVAIFVGGYLLGGRPSRPHPPGVSPGGNTTARDAPSERAGRPHSKSEELAIRVATFDSEEEAKAFVQQLAVRKLAATVVPVSTSAGVTLYSVQVGQYATRAAAAAAAKQLADEHGLHPAVVPAGMESLKER